MRIEGTYNFPAPIEQVFEALTNADVLGAIIPGCERLIQLGPAEPDGTISVEARLRLGPDAALYTAIGRVERLRRPAHLALDGHANGPHGPVTFHGSIDLVSQDGRTIAAYAWDVDARTLPEETQRTLAHDADAFAQTICDRLAEVLRAGQPDVAVADALPVLRADTRRGKIILLPPEPTAAPLTARARPLLRGTVWAGVGLVAGLAAIALAASIIRHWGESRPEHARK